MQSFSDEQLLFAALNGHDRAATVIVQRFRPYLMTIVRRRAGDLPRDIQKEIVQEAWAALFFKSVGAFNPTVMTAADYVGTFMSNAIDRVRAAYRAPGEPSRRRDSKKINAPIPAEVPALERLSEDDLSDKAQALQLERAENRIDIERACKGAPARVVAAVQLLLDEDLTFGQAAERVGLHRLALRRQLVRLRA